MKKNEKEIKEYSMKIKALREELCISQYELARQIGISSRSLRNFENYGKEPNTISKGLINKKYKEVFSN